MTANRRALLCVALWAACAGVALADTPHIGIQSPASIPTLTNTPLTVHLNFLVPVQDFTAASVVVSNAQVTNFSGSNADYFFTIQPLADGVVTFAILANTVHSTSDGAGNIELASTAFTYDATPPTLVLSSTSTSPTGAPIFVTATFSEPVSGFDSSKISLGNGSVGSFAALTSALYTFVAVPTTDGTTSISVSAGSAQDAAGNLSLAAMPLEFLFSNSPVATLSFFDASGNALSSTSPGGTVVVKASFSEPVANAPAIAVSGIDTLATTSMTQVDSTHYTYSYTAGATGGIDTVVVDGALDLVGNPQVPASSAISIVLPPPPPVVLIIPSSGGGGGGGGFMQPFVRAVTPTSTVATTTGQVLGASAYNFTEYLTLGMHGSAVLNLQKILIAGGYLPAGSATGYFGTLTGQALAQYQLAGGVAGTGSVGPLTRALLNKKVGSVLGASAYNFTTDLTLGSAGTDVLELQKILIAKKFLQVNAATGYYGLRTALAVSAYQGAHSLSKTGIVDLPTRTLLNAGTFQK